MTWSLARSRHPLVVGTLLSLAVVGPAGPGTAAPVPGSPTPTTVTPAQVPATAPAATSGTVAGTGTAGGPRLSRRGVQVDLPPGVPAPPRIHATGWIVADLDTGEVLAARQAHRGLAPASTLKILTVLALLPHLDPTARYTATTADATIDGSKVGLVPGSRYTVRDLLHGLMLGSGNDAANALAQLVGGTDVAAALMNAEAARLGATDTRAANTSGLDAVGQVSSAYDLALFARAALARPPVRRLVRTTSYRFPAQGRSLGEHRRRFEIQNHNRLLRNYPGATGVKNGYTTQARGSFVGSASRDGHRYVVALLRAEGITWHQARDLLDWAFAVTGRARPVGALADPMAANRTAPAATPNPGSGTAEPVAGSVTIVAREASATGPDLPVWPVTGAMVAGLGALVLRRRRRLVRRRQQERRWQEIRREQRRRTTGFPLGRELPFQQTSASGGPRHDAQRPRHDAQRPPLR